MLIICYIFLNYMKLGNSLLYIFTTCSYILAKHVVHCITYVELINTSKQTNSRSNELLQVSVRFTCSLTSLSLMPVYDDDYCKKVFILFPSKLVLTCV